MTAHHPWLRHSPEKVRDKLDAVSIEAAFLWHAVQMFIAASGGDGTIAVSKLSLATARRLSQARCVRLADELVGEGLMERPDTTRLSAVPWEQPPVDVWTDDVKRFRWTRDKQLKRDGELCRRVKERDRNLCRYCGIRVNWSDKRSKIAATYDHVDPDGPNSEANLVIACKGCNSKKRDRTPEQASMPLYKPGTTADVIVAGRGRLDAASAAQDRSPEPRARNGDLDPIQVGSDSDPNHGPDPPGAPAQDRTEPNRNRIGSGSGPTVEGPGTGASAGMFDREGSAG